MTKVMVCLKDKHYRWDISTSAGRVVGFTYFLPIATKSTKAQQSQAIEK
jgi:hypothetical protein